jgi:hypothetical protein
LQFEQRRKEADMQPLPVQPPRGQEIIADRAYQLWESEGRPEGRDVDHWFRAERELSGAEPELPADEAHPPEDEDSAASPGATPG